jgi:heme-degrading monooxygenase HmoA
MAMGQVMKFSGGNMGQYDAVTKELGFDKPDGWPSAVIAHSAGAVDDGFVVIEWWESEDDWNDFFATKLMPAFEKVGGIPQPEVTRFEVHASHIR